MMIRSRSLMLFLALSTVPASALAEPFQIISGSFSIGRPLIGPEAGSAALVWDNPPLGAFETSTRHDVSRVSAVWEPGAGYSSTLLGTTAPVQPLQPGPAPVGGTFSSTGEASFSFLSVPYDQTAPSLNQSILLRFSGGHFNVPAVFPPTDDEGLYNPDGAVRDER